MEPSKISHRRRIKKHLEQQEKAIEKGGKNDGEGKETPTSVGEIKQNKNKKPSGVSPNGTKEKRESMGKAYWGRKKTSNSMKMI